MNYAYANVKYDNGRWVAEPHTAVKGDGFTIDNDQARRLELREFGEYVFLVAFDPDDQFATVTTARAVKKMAAALTDFIRTIEATGGLTEDSEGSGMLAPVADDTWVDLGDSYELACAAMGKEPDDGQRSSAQG